MVPLTQVVVVEVVVRESSAQGQVALAVLV
jgi:hypothetical protein